MADERLTAKNAEFMLVCIAPDVCWTPIGKKVIPIPYVIAHTMDKSEQCSTNVFVNKKPVFLHAKSYVNHVKGDEPGTKGGVITGVNVKISHSLQKSPTVYVNKHPVVRTNDLVHMNTKKP